MQSPEHDKSKQSISITSREVVEQAVLAASSKQTTPKFTDWLVSPHRHPTLVSWLSLESIALIPSITRTSQGYLLWQFFSTSGNNTNLNSPWAFAVWEWPSTKLVRLERIRFFRDWQTPTLDSSARLSRGRATKIVKCLGNEQPTPKLEQTLNDLYSEIITKSYAPQKKKKIKSSQAPIIGSPENKETNNPLDSRFLDLNSASNQLEKLASKHDVQISSSELQQARDLSCRPPFTVAVCGEFSRGKTTLINSLLSRELLPTGALPTTTYITRIQHANKECLIWKQKSKPPLTLPLLRKSWDKLAEHLEVSSKGTMEVRLKQKWLGDGLRILDLPGTNDTSKTELEATLAALQTSDAALLCISATSPLSLTEVDLLENQILFHKVPRLAVAITFLDDLVPEQREQVLMYLIKRLKSIAPQAKIGSILKSNEIPSFVSLDFNGCGQLQELLTSWSRDKEHVNLVRLQILTRLKNYTQFVLQHLQAREDACKLSDGERRDRLDSKQREVKKRGGQWRNLALEFEEKREETVDSIERFLRSQEEAITEKLQYEARGRPNVSAWLKNDFSYRLKTEYKALTIAAEKLLNQRFHEDFLWLNNTIQKSFRHQLSDPNHQENTPPPSLDFDSKDLEQFLDLGKLKIYTQAGTALASVAGWILLGPLVSVVSMSGMVISNKIINKKSSQQTKEAEIHIKNIVSNSLAEALPLIRERVIKLYQQTSDNLQGAAVSWEDSQILALQKNQGKGDSSLSAQKNKTQWQEESAIILKKVASPSN